MGLIGARVGNGVNAGKIAAFALGAIENIHAVKEAAEPPRWAWILNTPIAPAPIARVLAELCLGSAAVEAAPLMRKAKPGETVSWLRGAPTDAENRLHILWDPRTPVIALERSKPNFSPSATRAEARYARRGHPM